MSHLFPLLCFSCLLLALTGCGTTLDDARVQADLTQALQEASIGQTAQARYWANQAIKENPGSLGTYVPVGDDADTLTIATVFASVDDEATLRDYMRQAASRFPGDYRPLQVITQADESLGDTSDLKKTATVLAALLERKINTPGSTHSEPLMLALAQAYCDAGDLAKGAADYQSVIQAFPKDCEPYNALAYAYAVADSKPNLRLALALAHKAIALVPQSPPANETQDDLDMTTAECQDTLGWVQYRLGDYTDARANLQAVLSSEPRIAESYYHLGMVYLALKEPEAARAEFDHAVDLMPGYADAATALAALPSASHANASSLAAFH